MNMTAATLVCFVVSYCCSRPYTVNLKAHHVIPISTAFTNEVGKISLVISIYILLPCLYFKIFFNNCALMEISYL
jgi:hypothetical protein